MTIFDLHVHTRPGSGDSCIEYKDLVIWAKKAGLSGICLTEHGSEKTGMAEKLSQEYDFLFLEGFETSTELGDILVFGLESVPRTLLRATALREYVSGHGGAMFAAHPFRSEISRPIMLRCPPRVTMEQALGRPLFKLVDGIEAANGWSAAEDVAFCFELCERLGLKSIGSSDAHMPKQLGCCVTVFHNSIRCEQDLVEELLRGNFIAMDRRRPEQQIPTYWFSSP